MSLVAGATLFFLLLHALVARLAPGQPFHIELKISRGLASIVLTAIGFYGLWQWWPLWPQAFLARHAPDSEAWRLVAFVTGHFVADFLLLAWGALRRDSAPRPDLLAHHTLGIVVCAVVFYYGMGHALFAVALTTELMPVTSGLAALALLRQQPALERRATQLRLAVLTFWRLPFWAFMVTVLLWRMGEGGTDGLMALGQRIALGAMAVVIVLDAYWVRLCLASLRPQAAPR